MPIFTSRFSQEKSLIGTFLLTQSRKTDDAESRTENRNTNSASTQNAQQSQDRLELTGNQQTTVAVAQARATTQAIKSRSETVSTQTAFRIDIGALRESLRIIPSESPTQIQLSPDLSETVQTEQARSNQEAAENAIPDRLKTLVDQLETLRTDQASAQEENTVESTVTDVPEQTTEASEDSANTQPTDPVETNAETAPSSGPVSQLNALVEQLSTQPQEQGVQAPPAREEQKAELQNSLKTISTGLQKDAAIENQRTAKETTRNTEITAQRQQRTAIRDNQGEIRNLQTSQRSLDQEVQRTNQAIRQLQSENARLRNTSTESGTTLNLLVQ